MEKSETKKALENAVKVAASIRPDMEEILGIQAKIMWSYYNQLKNEGFTDDQAFELVKNAAPKQLEVKLKKQ
ncbi:MAG: hypothetical protein NTY03_11130 [Candidatus Bathyarchaeota archaeon]|nr:hypothetical protein [Candidatus Bathyarchaeota archaeon]